MRKPNAVSGTVAVNSVSPKCSPSKRIGNHYNHEVEMAKLKSNVDVLKRYAKKVSFSGILRVFWRLFSDILKETMDNSNDSESEEIDIEINE